MKRFQVTIPDPVVLKLRQISEEKDISVSEIIRRGLELFFEAEAQKKGFLCQN